MENHPIPQDVTGFQFKLIGNMTVRQFVYLAVGVVIAWIFLVSPLTALIKLPLTVFFGILGFALAFLPIDGRPLDSMILYFLKALVSPNQYVFEKTTSTSYAVPISLPTVAAQPSFTPSPSILPKAEISLSPLPQKQTEVKKEAPLPQPQQVTPLPMTVVPEQPKNLEYQHVLTQYTKTQEENKRLEEELAALKKTLAQTQTPTQPVVTPPAPVVAPPPPAAVPAMVKKTKIIPSAKPIGLATPDVPNILIGIVKDPRGNILPNILVEVKDKDGSPVRAFKTNAFGQFASATPLLNGVYTLEFEDPQVKNKFDALELTMNGAIIGPIEVTSVDQREELRKSLFPNA